MFNVLVHLTHTQNTKLTIKVQHPSQSVCTETTFVCLAGQHIFMMRRKRQSCKISSDTERGDEAIEIDSDSDSIIAPREDSSSTVTCCRKDAKNTASIEDSSESSVELMIPLSLLMSGNDCSVLAQVMPEDAPTLDFHGASGAVGRFEVNDDSVTMDLKGYQYQGNLQAGPTCLVVSMHPLIGENMMKIESVTDEFVTLQKTGDHMTQLDGCLEKGQMDESFTIRDDNVNNSGAKGATLISVEEASKENTPKSKIEVTKERKTNTKAMKPVSSRKRVKK